MFEQLKLDNQLCFRLYTAARMVTSAYTPLFKDLGITYPQYLVLMVLWEKDHCLIGEITERLKLETNTVTPLLQRMERQGLIERKRGDVDTRQRIVSLTPKGKEMEERAKDIPLCLAQNIVGHGITVEELKTLAPLLDKFIGALSTGV